MDETQDHRNNNEGINKTPQVLSVLEALKQASNDIQSNPTPKSSHYNSSSIKALLELETESDSILSNDPNLSSLSTHLANLKTLIESLNNSRSSYSFKSFLSRRISSHSISRIAASIGVEIQAWIDRESLNKLSFVLQENPISDEEKLIKLLTQFETRLSQGFNRELQDLILKSRIFNFLELVLCSEKHSRKVREYCAFSIVALIKFNKDVFVGQVFMGTTIEALITMGSPYSIKVLCGLIQTIKSPLVDKILSNGEIPKIISFLNCKENVDIRISALDCVLEIGYYGRREAIEAMIKEGLIEILVELQRSKMGGDLIDMERSDQEDDVQDEETSHDDDQIVKKNDRPFVSCVARFAVQLEVGEGLRQREKRAFKQEILVRIRKTCDCDAEVANIVAEVLWGSSP